MENPTSASEQTRLGREKELRYKNYEDAVKWYRKAAEQGYAEAQISLGAHYSLGLAVKQDLKTAVEWYRRAAEQGNLKGQLWFADCHKEGEGVPQNKTEALKWYRRAAMQGDKRAE